MTLLLRVAQSPRFAELRREGFIAAPGITSAGFTVLHRGAERKFLTPEGEEVSQEDVVATTLRQIKPTTPSN